MGFMKISFYLPLYKYMGLIRNSIYLPLCEYIHPCASTWYRDLTNNSFYLHLYEFIDLTHNSFYLPLYEFIDLTNNSIYLPLYEYMGLMRKIPDSCSMESRVSIRRLARRIRSDPMSSILSAQRLALCQKDKHNTVKPVLSDTCVIRYPVLSNVEFLSIQQPICVLN